MTDAQRLFGVEAAILVARGVPRQARQTTVPHEWAGTQEACHEWHKC